MKIALLHGALINSGDFLIAQRSKELLKYVYPDAIITEYYRNQSIEPYLTEINNHNIMILAGGPGYVNEFYPTCAPLMPDLSMIKIPIMFLGMGWWGPTNLPTVMYNYSFSGPMLDLLKRASNDTKCLTCRDYLTTSVIRNNGFDNVIMTGCPAWYHIPSESCTKYTKTSIAKAKKICISDCVNPCFYHTMIELIKYVKKFYINPDITLVIHRGMTNFTQDILNFLSENNIKHVDISGSAEGFKIYDDCDLHIGFRVHSHIYNLSKRNLSILIAEDSRGLGVNSALGLPNITAGIHTIQNNNFSLLQNPCVNLLLEDYLFDLISNDYLQINRAYETMSKTFDKMIQQIQNIKNYI